MYLVQWFITIIPINVCLPYTRIIDRLVCISATMENTKFLLVQQVRARRRRFYIVVKTLIIILLCSDRVILLVFLRRIILRWSGDRCSPSIINNKLVCLCTHFIIGILFLLYTNYFCDFIKDRRIVPEIYIFFFISILIINIHNIRNTDEFNNMNINNLYNYCIKLYKLNPIEYCNTISNG